MKILHTSDWHLGHVLYNDSQESAQQEMLDDIAEKIASEKPDVVLISGDIYDTTQPSTSVQQMFADAIVKFHDAYKDVTIICIAGNHDSGSKHMIFHTPWKALNVHMVGNITKERNLEDYIFEIKDKGYVVAVPFAADRFMPDNVFTSLSDMVAERNTNNLPVVLMAHLAVDGCDFRGHDNNDIEEKIIGGIHCQDVTMFGDGYDYVALGHIHKQQSLDAEKRIWYSGTPIAVSFDEVYKGNSHGILMVQCDHHGDKPDVTPISITCHQPLVNIPAEGFVSWEEAKKLLNDYPNDIASFLRINVEVEKCQPAGATEEAVAIIEKTKKICKLCFINYQKKKGEIKEGTPTQHKAYTPTEIKDISIAEAVEIFFTAKDIPFDSEIKEMIAEVNSQIHEDNQ